MQKIKKIKKKREKEKKQKRSVLYSTPLERTGED